MDISVVIPVFNEEENLVVLQERLVNVITSFTNDYEIIFVNDGSKDNSLSVLKGLVHKNPQIKYIDLSKNFGHQTATFAGLEHANGNAIVIMDRAPELTFTPRIPPNRSAAAWS